MSFRTPPTSPTKKTPGAPVKKKKSPQHQFQTEGTNLSDKLAVAAGIQQQEAGGRRRRRKSKRKSHKKSHKKKRKTKRRRKSRKKRTKRRRRR